MTPSRSIRRSLATLIVLSSSATASLAAPVPTDCEEGVFDLLNHAARPGGEMVESRATSTRFCPFDGDVSVDEYRALGPDGETIFRGVSLGRWNDDRTRKTILWLMVGDPGMTLISARVEGDRLLAEGKGEDGLGPFEERSRRTWRDDGSSEFTMDRYYPRFERWIEPFNRIEKTPTDRPVPAAPSAPHELLAGAGVLFPEPGTRTARVETRRPGREPVTTLETTRSRLILDGLAVLSWIETRPEEGAPAEQRRMRFSVVDPEPPAWREVTWDLAIDEVTARTRRLDRTMRP